MKVYEKYSASDHIAVQAAPVAVVKGDLVVIGGLVGVADMSAATGAPISLGVGIPVSVFSVAIADAGFTPTIGTMVYATPGGGLAATAAGNVAFGTVVQVNADTFEFARV